MLRIKVRGDSLHREDWNRIVREVKSQTVRSVGDESGGLSVGPGGTSITRKQHRRRPVFAIEFMEDTGAIKVKAAHRGAAGGWSVSQGDDQVGYYQPWPGYDRQTFEEFFLADPNTVAPGELACEVDGQFLVPPSSGTSSVPGFSGRIFAVNYPDQLCIVAPFKFGTDVTSPEEINKPDNYNLEATACCWTGGWTGAKTNMLVHVLDFANMPISSILPLYNLTGPKMERACRPDGPFSPELPPDCPDPPEDNLECGGVACCKEDGTCVNIPISACLGLGGTPFEEFKCDDREMQENCTPPSACCTVTEDFGCECQNLRPFECEEIGGIINRGVTCEEGDCCFPLIPCCVPAQSSGDCVDLSTSGCLMITQSECRNRWFLACSEDGVAEEIAAGFAQCENCASVNCETFGCA